MMQCYSCGQDEDCRLGFCFECATIAEDKAAKRTVVQHLKKAVSHFYLGLFVEARIDLCWAWERLTGTGDYAPDGEFSRTGNS